MSIIGLIVLLLLGFVTVVFLPRAFRSIGASVAEFRRPPEDRDRSA